MVIVKRIWDFGNNLIERLYYKVLKKPTMKQELLLRLALKERGLNLKNIVIQCDHNLGFNYVNGIKFGIKYPQSFFENAEKLIPINKPYDFYFNGNMNEEGERKNLLKPFMNLSNSLIVSSNEGRVIRNKDKFNTSYFSEFAQAKFGLCPHQVDWDGSVEHMWTYRFIESIFIEAIPVLFKKTPLGDSFIRGFYFVWEDEILNSKNENDYAFYQDLAKKNQILAKQKFCFTDLEIESIKATLL